MKTMFHMRRGFTLVEVLVVVLIGIAAAIIAVPIYKNSQDKNRYLAASGVLLDVGNAMNMMLENYPSVAISPTQITSNGASLEAQELAKEPTSSNIMPWLRGNQYLRPISFSGDPANYKGYSFYVKTTGTFDATHCCAVTSTVDAEQVITACMTGANRNSEYTCVWVDKFGNLHHNMEGSSVNTGN